MHAYDVLGDNEWSCGNTVICNVFSNLITCKEMGM
jgi:hypothetical protein